MTERTLVQAAQAGRSDAADELVERYYPRVYSFVSTFRAGDAEDITQEVFARALVALPRFNGEYQFGAWLLQIARNICIDEARRQVHRAQPTDPIDLVELEPVTTQPDDVWESVSSQIAVTTVHRAMAKLPQRMRTALVLRELEGMSYADIAIALRISTRAVEISLSRARKRLRLELQRIDVAEEELAACRRASGLRASGPITVSKEEAALHIRTCPICQGMGRKRRPKEAAHAVFGFMLAGSTHAGVLVRRPFAWAHGLAQNALSSSGVAGVSPMSRLAEIGASVAVATAVSAGTFANTQPAPPAFVFPPPALVAPAPPLQPAPVQPPAPVPAVPPPATPAQPATPAAAAQIADTAQCSRGAPGGAPSGPAPAAPAPAGPNDLLGSLVGPQGALSPLLGCNGVLATQLNSVLAGVNGGLNALLGGLLGGGGPQASN